MKSPSKHPSKSIGLQQQEQIAYHRITNNTICNDLSQNGYGEMYIYKRIYVHIHVYSIEEEYICIVQKKNYNIEGEVNYKKNTEDTRRAQAQSRQFTKMTIQSKIDTTLERNRGNTSQSKTINLLSKHHSLIEDTRLKPLCSL